MSMDVTTTSTREVTEKNTNIKSSSRKKRCHFLKDMHRFFLALNNYSRFTKMVGVSALLLCVTALPSYG